MKTINLKLAVSLLVLFSFLQNVEAQRYVNQDWSSITGLPINIHWSASMIASSGHIVTVGNTYTSGQSTNVLLTKYATDGSIVWQVEYDNPDNLEDYGIALCEDDSGNFYVAGTSYRSSSSSLELTVLKFNSGGTNQWAYFFDGSASGDDIPAGIATDGINVYVAGGTESVSSATDFVTIKLKHDGTSLWTEYYDHNSLADVAVDIDINQSGHVIVSGGSADQANVYDMATIKYDGYGNTVNEHRSNYNVGIDQPTCFDMDANGNTVIGGNYIPNPGEMQISVISLDDTLGLNWSLLHDPAAGEDNIVGLVTDASGNIYVTGHTEETSGYFKCYTAKIDNNGNVQWERAYQSPSGGAFGKAIRLTPTGDVIVGGMNYDASGDTNIIVLTYATNGRPLSSKEYDAGGAEIASSLEADNWGSIYVHGTSTSNTNGYVTLKYSSFDRPRDIAIDTFPEVDYMDNEIIIRVNPSLVDTNAINDKGKTFGQFSDFVKQKVIDSLDDAFSYQYFFARFPAIKAYRRFSIGNEHSLSRLGDTVDVPPFWATFILLIPESLDEYGASKIIENEKSVVEFAEVNIIGEYFDIPNDPGIANDRQTGLESTHTPDYDIEMDRAWDIHHGTNSARLGIFDSGLNWAHEDLSIDGSNTFLGSKVDGGWNWNTDSPISSDPDNDFIGHGTAVTGVAAALRNNNMGIAGVAGGDANNANSGCSLFAFNVSSEGGGVAWSDLAEAVAEGALWDPNANPQGYNLDVINLSLGRDDIDDDVLNLQESIKFAYNNDCVVAAASGNTGDQSIEYPASFNYRWLIKVGANDESGDRSSLSVFGNALDLIAPGVDSIYQSLDSDDIEGYSYSGSGTSFASPHVAGAAALLMSYVNDNWNPNGLAPDDVEFLFMRYASDVGDPGYDAQNGAGRLNLGEVMENMEWPFYWVEHFQGNTTNYTATQIATNQQVSLVNNSSGLASGTYFANVFEIEFTVNHNIGNATLLDSWIRNGAANSNMTYNSSTVTGWAGAELVSANSTSATIRGHIYNITTSISGQLVNAWTPFENGQAAEYAYSLHLHDAEASGVISNSAISEGNLVLYPNPASESHSIQFSPANNIQLRLFDIQGKQIRNIDLGDADENRIIEMDISNLEPGLYIYQINSDRYNESVRFIVEN